MPEGFSHTTKTNAELDKRVKAKRKVRVKKKTPAPARPHSDSADTARRKDEVDREVAKNERKRVERIKKDGVSFEEARRLQRRYG